MHYSNKPAAKILLFGVMVCQISFLRVQKNYHYSH